MNEKITWVRPYLEIPAEPSPAPFKLSIVNRCITGVLFIGPMLVHPYYKEHTFDLNAPITDKNVSSSLYKVLEDMWIKYMETTPGAMDCRKDKFGNPIVDPSLRVQWVDRPV